MRRHQSYHNYQLPSPVQETERPRPPLSPACFTHKYQQIYRELFMRRHQSYHNYQLPSPAQETERPRPPLSTACFPHKRQQIYRELFMRWHQSYHNYQLPSPAQETKRPCPQLSTACFTHKRQQIYRELFALPPSLGKTWAESQSLIMCVGIKVVTTTICPLPPRKQKGHAHHSHPHASLTSAHKFIECFLYYHPRCERYGWRGNP